MLAAAVEDFPVKLTVMEVAVDTTLLDSVTAPVAYVAVTEILAMVSMSAEKVLVVIAVLVVARAATELTTSPEIVQIVTSLFANILGSTLTVNLLETNVGAAEDTANPMQVAASAPPFGKSKLVKGLTVNESA
jgi:hypothetical protein